MIDFGNKCVILTRVSTQQQDYDAQLNDLRNWAISLGLEVVKDISTKESGFRSWDKKDGFHEVIDFMNSNQCRIILCTEPSRLARDKFILEQIKNWLTTNRIQLYIKDINFKLFNDNGEVDMSTDILFSVQASIAQAEMKDKKKRLARGLKGLQKEGYCITGKTTFGYTRITTEEKIRGKHRSTFIINPVQAEQIKSIYNWYMNGIDGDPTLCSISDINKECIAKGFDRYLHSWRNVNKCLKEEGYTGYKVTNNKRKNPEYWEYGNENAPKYIPCSSELKFPPIISKELFNSVRAKMLGRNTHMDCTKNELADKSRKHITLLSKMLRCPVCGHFLIGNYRYKQGYLMNFYKCADRNCNYRFTFSMKFLDGAVWAFCVHHFDEYMRFLRNYSSSVDPDDIKQRIVNFEKKKIEFEKSLEEYIARYLETTKFSTTEKIKSTFEKGASELKGKISEYENLIVKAKEELDMYNDPGTILKKLSSTTEIVEGSKTDMRKYIHYMIDFITPVYKDNRYTVLWVFPKQKNKIHITQDVDVVHEASNIYLIIDGNDNNRPQIRYMNSTCKFDCDTSQFVLSNGHCSIKDAFGDVDEVYFHRLPYKRLDIYKDDFPKKQ